VRKEEIQHFAIENMFSTQKQTAKQNPKPLNTKYLFFVHPREASLGLDVRDLATGSTLAVG
jgi:hypothetical protein